MYQRSNILKIVVLVVMELHQSELQHANIQGNANQPNAAIVIILWQQIWMMTALHQNSR